MTHPAAELIERIGLLELTGTDGCLCGSCEVRGVAVDISCRKSGGSGDWSGTLVRVTSSHLDVTPGDLADVAAVAARQLAGEWNGQGLRFRFCTYEQDRDRKCGYCAGARAPSAYICEPCQSKESLLGRVVDLYDYSAIDAALNETAKTSDAA